MRKSDRKEKEIEEILEYVPVVHRVNKEKIDTEVLDQELKSILDNLPEMDPDIVKNPDINANESNMSQFCEEYQIESEIATPFNPIEAVQMIIERDLLKDCALYDISIIRNLYSLLEDEKILDTLENLFWMVYQIKFDNNKRLNTINELRRNIGFIYSQVFGSVNESRFGSKEEILSLLQFVFAYLIHAYHYKLFIKNRKALTSRFILDCYHIVIYIMTGVFVTDYFIHDHIEKIFRNNFFQYQIEKVQLKNVNSVQDFSAFQDIMDIKKEEFNFFKEAKNVTHNDIADSRRLLRDIIDKFKVLTKLEQSKSSGIYKRIQNEIISNLNDIAVKEDCDNVLIQRAKQKQLFLTQRQEMANSNLQSARTNIGESSLVSPRQEKDPEQEKLLQNNVSLPSINKKFKFDCAQISPGIQSLLSKSIANVRNKKTISFSTYQVPAFDIEDLSELYNKYGKKHDDRLNRLNSAVYMKKMPFMKGKILDHKENNDNKLSARVLRMAQNKFEDSEWYNYFKHTNIGNKNLLSRKTKKVSSQK